MNQLPGKFWNIVEQRREIDLFRQPGFLQVPNPICPINDILRFRDCFNS
jgi:hypothetical protein